MEDEGLPDATVSIVSSSDESGSGAESPSETVASLQEAKHRLWVTNIPYLTTDREIIRTFARYNIPIVSVMFVDEPGMRQNFAVVAVSNFRYAICAVQLINGHPHKGQRRPLGVQMHPIHRGSDLLVHYKAEERHLCRIFQRYGFVFKVQVERDRDTERLLGVAFVRMHHKKNADAAVQGLDDRVINGQYMTVRHM